MKRIKRLIRNWKQKLCNHEFEADKQITIVICNKCDIVFFYTKEIDLHGRLEGIQDIEAGLL